MFFSVSKLVWLFVQPSSLLLILLVAGAALLFTRFQKLGRRLVVAGVALFVVLGLLPICNLLQLPLDERFARADLSRGVDGIVVLGGGEEPAIAAVRGVHALNDAGDRFTETVALARRFPQAKIVFTSGSTDEPDQIGADAGEKVLKDLGVESDRLIFERQSRNTWENAVYTKALVDPKPGERWLLVTSAAHMPRAIGSFRKVGFAVEPWPVDYRTTGRQDLYYRFDAAPDGLKRLDGAVREWVGLVVYWLTGRSSALFPGPDGA
jgi:uncharacterized SAM-binding protein YcdF (DUF218 family)